MTTMKPTDMLAKANARIGRLERENARLVSKLGQLRNMYPGREKLEILEMMCQDWATMNRNAVDDDEQPAFTEDELAFLDRSENWVLDVIGLLFDCRTALRGPGARERAIEEHRVAIETMDKEGIV